MTTLPDPPSDAMADPAFHACLLAVEGDFAAAVARLCGHPVPARSGLAAAIDEAAGLTESFGRLVVAATYELIYRRLPPAVLADLRAGMERQP